MGSKGKGKDQGTIYEAGQDLRLDFIFEYVTRCFKIKQDKWTKLLTTEEYRKIVTSFLEVTDAAVLVFTLSNSGILTAMEGYATVSKTKSCYFIKKHPQYMHKEDPTFKENLIYGDLSPQLLENLVTNMEEIIGPISWVDMNDEKWPDQVVSDSKERSQIISNTLHSLKGQLKGKTWLPVPLNLLELSQDLEKDNELSEDLTLLVKKQAETVVLKWSHQVSEVLERDSMELFQNGKYPTPAEELRFWENRAEDLQCIFSQLKENKIQVINLILQKTKSRYWDRYKHMFFNVESALQEARSILAYFKPLRRHLELIASASFDSEMQELLRPMMHTVCLMWVYSPHYRLSQRIILLFRGLCNLLIESARGFLSGSLIFQLEPEEGYNKLKQVREVLELFKELYHAHKAALPHYFEEDQEVVHWDFLPNLIFTRYDVFLGRIKQLEDFFETTVEFYKLEKMEIGGSRGRQLGLEVEHIFEAFSEYFQKFSSVSYDCCDPEDNSYTQDYHIFLNKSQEIDFRISYVLVNAMQDCHTPESAFKLITVFGPLLHRPIIKEDFLGNFPSYLELLKKEMTQILEMFDEQVLGVKEVHKRTMVNRLLPPFSATVHWIKYAKDRIEMSVSQFQSLELEGISEDLVEDMLQKYRNTIKFLVDYQKETFKEWSNKIKREAPSYLNKHLLTRDSRSGALTVNGSMELAMILKEVKYLQMADFTEIPPIALTLHSKNQDLRKCFTFLHQICKWYNAIQGSITVVERSLLKSHLESIEEIAVQGESAICWKNENIFDYINSLRGPVEDIKIKLETSQANFMAIRDAVASWNTEPLFKRHGKSNYKILNIEPESEQERDQIFEFISNTSKVIQEKCQENKTLLVGDVSSGDAIEAKWTEYLHNIDEEIIGGLVKVVASSVGYLLDHTDFNITPSPLFEVHMKMEDNKITYSPPLDEDLEESFVDRMQWILWTTFQPAALVDRVCLKTGGNYLEDILQNPDLMDMRKELIERVQAAVSKALEFTQCMIKYSYIWEDDRAEHLRQFLKYGHQLTQEELDLKDQGETIPDTPPKINQFQDAIDKYVALLHEVEKFETEKLFHGWFRLNMKPFVDALRDATEQWILMFKQHLIDTVVGGLANLETFINDNEKGMMVTLVEGDLKSLISVMGILQQIKLRTKAVESMFGPTKEYIELLKKYDYELPETVFIQLEELPVRWEALLKQAGNVKMAVAPLQHHEVSSIKKRIADFDVDQQAYRDIFKEMVFFDINCPFPFNDINTAERIVAKYEGEFESIRSAAKLFEVVVPEPKDLRRCRREIRFAKQLWDYTELVNGTIDDWKMSPWQTLNTENMDLECKRMAKEVKAMDKDVKAWTLYTCLEATIRNIVSSLKSVGELQNPNIKDRHWQELLDSTKILPKFIPLLIDKFVRDERTTFADLYGLGLHNYEEEVKNVVDKAVKESSIEKTLKEFTETWAEQVYDFDMHSRTQTKLIKPSEDLIEILEDNQVQLQTIAMSKYIAFFKEEVDYWQNLLLQADNVLSSLVEVQRTWCHLESIFKGSEDIRINLPEDSARFDRIDRDFKKTLTLMYKTTNVIEGTNQPDIYSEITRIQGELSLCEKALADYLETKRLKFPRFYFVSSADLLDILATGDEPQQVGRHLPKLFDSLAGLVFETTGDADKLKYTHSMKAKDGEIVRLYEPCNCAGAVEDWLNRLEFSMRQSIRLYMEICVHAYGEKSREKWIQDYPAQVALCGTQIWWTTEVNIAFSKLEDGNETALKDYFKRQVNQLNLLISLLVGELTSQERQKVMTICTIDVHSRDVVGKLVQMRIETGSAFQWQSQLRHRWDEQEEDCFSNICDAQLRYLHEYLGNTPRLVITPLTDRCYITLTQSLHLIMGGAPAGPAGTGKTETTKDLGRALGVMVYVFNCSEQMDYRSVGSIFKGLAMTGAWGCFDEFNRISVEVLSVVAVQVKSMQDAIRDRKSRFNFMGEEIGLVEWKDGIFSVLMRDLANMPGDGPKWIVLDGDIDPMWIESLNTVMDDNKVLTLARFKLECVRPELVEQASGGLHNERSAGSGKTVLIRDALTGLPENYAVANVPFNFYTTSEMLQRVLEKPLEKKAGRNYGPPGNKQLAYFIDDLNMPMVDEYETVQPHTLIRQHMDYGHWFDRLKIQLKDIHNVQYVASMNPTAGSFTINPRLQRHFAVFSLGFPGQDSLQTIYKTILQQHLALHLPLQNPLHKMSSGIVNAALALHTKVVQSFLPTATKFHYVFNLRDLSNIFQGLLFSTSDCLKTSCDLVRLWLHESTRVYGDKLVDDKDISAFQKFAYDCFKKQFEDLDEVVILAKPLIFYHFASGAGDAKYMPVSDFVLLQNSLIDALKSYNDFNSIMNLVLFDAAVNYICRISRILESPRGNALLVGVGGSGKQSLARLAAFLSGLDVFQVTLRKGYTILELKGDLAALYLKAGQKNLGTMFLMTDAQVAEERFLVLINDMLASGEINDLLPDDEVENVLSAMRSEVKAVGLQDSRENCWKFFIDRVRKVLKTVLCFSPVGSTLRTRSRKFPAVTNSTAIVWFQEWPQEALMSVSQRFVQDIEVLPASLLDPIATFMAYVHMSVSDISKVYLANEKRYNYTTPKSFLEQIDLYGKLVTQKTNEALHKANRLESGLTKLESCAEQVEELKKTLAVQEIVLKEKNDKADELIKIVGEETAIVSVEKENAAMEEANVAVVAEEVAKIQVLCQIELEKAEPALQAAYAALNTLNKTNLTELKTFTTPPGDVVLVVAAVFILWEGTRTGKLPKDKSWKATKSQMMGDIGKFLDGLQNLNKENITPMIVEALKPYMTDPGFQPELIRAKSFAASGLCSYVINVLKFNEVWQDVAPKRKALQEATDELNRNLDKLKFLKGRIGELEEKLAILTQEFEVATEAKMKCQAEADKTNATIDLANRLVGGLASEKIRWIQSVQNFRESTVTIPGDMLLVTAFVSYMGCFTKKYRIDLLDKNWVPYLEKMIPPIPMSGNVDPLKVLTDDAEIADWNTFGLPSDRMSIENATILVNSQRWPLMIDPQLQGVKWIKSMYGTELRVIRLGQKGYLDVIESITQGHTVLIENIMESVEPVLEPLLARNLIKKGTAIKLGDKEIDFNPKFRLILQSKLSNPHYQPEMQAQTTLINFTVTRDGLEDQLLAEVVKVERPDLEALKSQLTQQQNEFKILLLKLEDDLLFRLQSAEGDFLEDDSLVRNLETTKRTSSEVEVKAREAVITSKNIDSARELYRPASSRASLLYFILNDLNKINPIYQFSLKAFSTVFQNAIRLAVPASQVSQRVENLIDSISYSVWLYTTRGLFESDKLIFTAQMGFQIQLQREAIQPRDFDFLMRFPTTPNVQSPVDFLTNYSWGAVKSLSGVDDFRGIDRDIESGPKKWKSVVDSECPERESFPGDWRSRVGVPRLCIMRCLRPDRMMYAVSVFIEETLGSKYVKSTRLDFSQSYKETSRETPVFFILSPGVDPLKDVESLGKKIGFTIDNGKFHNVSLGQGQEVVAENALEVAGREGHWVILQNIHLVARWLPTLEKKLEQNWDSSTEDYRVFLSAEPAGRLIPQGILESSIKITNEAPTGMLANVHKALDNFNQETLETCSKELEFKAILFTLCYFHAVVAERRKFGTQGWNRSYPFNTGDLTISVNVLYNYLEANTKVPWEDLRYLFGEIMYGGHITDDWDRRLCRSYLEEFMVQESLDGEIDYAPGFPAPPSTDYVGYHNYIDELLPPESPTLYGLHPNAEIGFLTATSDTLFKTIFELQPRDSGGAGGQAATKEEKIKQILDDVMEKLPDPFNMNEVQGRAEEKTPYVVVALQECERMNMLTVRMRRSLKELDSGLKGELTMTTEMEDLGNAIFMDQVPPSWNKVAYPSTLGLASWYADLLLRVRELETWSTDFLLPPAIWLSGFFNPQSFLTAIMQSTARKQELPLDKMCLQCDVTKKTREEMTVAPKEGACIHGLFMEGARWDVMGGCIAESRLKDLFPLMPVIFMKAITQDKQDNRSTYECPVYKTRSRGPHYVWTFNLRTKERASKWVLGGVAILLQV
ncbi:unnamed protein product [Allacma fusca]|uniref:Uncharacterized protein n=1 Tax=Allacma fusca TaxID=39272 RepID=A0A8J2JBV9_9HEXA|nr:unnamed protein product [Allacma fusca]